MSTLKLTVQRRGDEEGTIDGQLSVDGRHVTDCTRVRLDCVAGSLPQATLDILLCEAESGEDITVDAEIEYIVKRITSSSSKRYSVRTQEDGTYLVSPLAGGADAADVPHR